MHIILLYHGSWKERLLNENYMNFIRLCYQVHVRNSLHIFNEAITTDQAVTLFFHTLLNQS